jgi:hypothetical protein
VAVAALVDFATVTGVGPAVAGFAVVTDFAATAAGSATGVAVAAGAGFALGVTGFAVAARPPAARFDTLAAAAARAAVAALEVAALAVAALAEAVAAFTVAAFAVAAFADADLVVTAAVVAAAALAREASVPPAEAADVLRAGRQVGSDEVGTDEGASDEAGEPSAVVGADPVLCAFPWRCVGTVLVAFSPVDRREVPRAGTRVFAVPVTGSGPSTRRWSWWSGFMHLTSVGRHCTRTPGERSGTHVNTP